MINENRLVDAFMSYVKISSPSCYEGEFALFLMTTLKNLGLTVEMDEAGNMLQSNSGNIIAKLKGTLRGKPILFSAHMDTVNPGHDIEPVRSEGFIHSSGQTILGADDKAGIACIIEALACIKETKCAHRDLEIVFTIFEEGGLNGSKHLSPQKLKAHSGYVLDSSTPPGHIITKGPSQNKLEFSVKGLAAHAGVSPEKGISAIGVASEAIRNMKLLRIDEDTTANIGVISGGVATNIVMPEVNIIAEARSLDPEKLLYQTRHMIACFEDAAKVHETTVKSDVQTLYPILNIEDDAPVVKHALEAFKACNLTATLAKTGGGSDAHIFSANGIPTVNLGIGVKKAHTVNEHIAISDMVTMANVTLALMTR